MKSALIFKSLLHYRYGMQPLPYLAPSLLPGLPPVSPTSTATPLYAQIDRSKKTGSQPNCQQQQNYTNLGKLRGLTPPVPITLFPVPSLAICHSSPLFLLPFSRYLPLSSSIFP